MAIETGRLSESRIRIAARELGVLLVAAAVMLILVYVSQREGVVSSGGLSQTAVENSLAFVREHGAVQPKEIYGSAAYLREVPAAAVVFTAEAIWSSGAHVREHESAPTSAIPTTWAQAREGTRPTAPVVSRGQMFNSGSHLRERAN